MGILAAHSGPSKVCSSHHYLHAVRLIRQQWELRNAVQTRGRECEQGVEQDASPSFMSRELIFFKCGWWGNNKQAVKEALSVRPACMCAQEDERQENDWHERSWEMIIICCMLLHVQRTVWRFSSTPVGRIFNLWLKVRLAGSPCFQHLCSATLTVCWLWLLIYQQRWWYWSHLPLRKKTNQHNSRNVQSLRCFLAGSRRWKQLKNN